MTELADPNQPERSQLDGSGRFFPHISFYPSISPPQHALTVGKWVNPDGEFRLNTNCLQPGGRDAYWNVMHSQVSNTGHQTRSCTPLFCTTRPTFIPSLRLSVQSHSLPHAMHAQRPLSVLIGRPCLPLKEPFAERHERWTVMKDVI